MTEKAPNPVLGFDCGKFPPDLLAKFEESAASIQGDVLKFAGLLVISSQCRQIFETETGLTLDEWAQKITEGDGIRPETAS